MSEETQTPQIESIASRVLTANVANLVNKVKSSKPLSAGEVKLVEQMAERSSADGFRWPVYDTIQQAASATGWPVEILRHCKKSGCPAFRHSRIHYGELPGWFFAQKGEDQENWTKRDKRAAALLKEAELEKQKERTITKEELSPVIIESMATLYSSLQRFFVDDQPKKAQGMTEADIRALNQQFVNLAFADYKGKMLAKVEPKQLTP